MKLLNVTLGTYTAPDSFSMVPRHCARAVHEGREVVLLPERGSRNNRLNALKGATEWALKNGYNGISAK